MLTHIDCPMCAALAVPILPSGRFATHADSQGEECSASRQAISWATLHAIEEDNDSSTDGGTDDF